MSVSSQARPDGLLEELPAVDLPRMRAAADLQRRFDRKYLVDRSRLSELIAGLPDDVMVLEVDGSRRTAYTSTYFDTDDRRTFRDHVQRRRRRFKIRTRHYGDPAAAMLEVKCKGRRGQTVKHRWPHPGPSPQVLDDAALHLADGALFEQYGFHLPDGLARTATIRFERITLLLPSAGERVTIDVDLSVETDDRHVSLGSTHAVVETKEPVRRGAATAALVDRSIRPDRVSKYGVAVIATHEGLRGNRWLPALRTFGVADLSTS